MKKDIITKVINDMTTYLTDEQLKKLMDVLENSLQDYHFEKVKKNEEENKNNILLLDMFISSKRVEGCSNKSIKYYKYTLKIIFDNIKKDLLQVTSDDIRNLLDKYQRDNNVSKVTVDNVRRVLSSFFKWLEEDYIIKNPVRKIHKTRTGKIVKEAISDENLEILRDNCDNIRDLLISSGIRVGELLKLNISDIDFYNRECKVFGKGEKDNLIICFGLFNRLYKII